ncbi:MAG: pyrroline-5-carboxylate reductase [Candidatus Peribacteraceae bacterium]|nr:pyrroline-5-carboxylate reductase [Candidatus Peribacteraceae bacterium]
MNHTLAIIGVGNMGSAFAYGLSHMKPAMILRLCDGNSEKLRNFPNAKHFTDPKKAIVGTSAILLAVKPQSSKELLNDLSPLLKDRLVISIMAGISLKTLGKLTGSKRIVRAMPNLPATIGLGCTGWCATPAVSKPDRTFVETIFGAVGTQIELNDESKLDAVTAISGSGPAYFFLLAELLGIKALKEGFSPQESAVLARATMIGSGVLAANDKRTLTELREAVTSKGGTTEAALASLKGNHLDTIINEAIDAAIARSRKLS